MNRKGFTLIELLVVIAIIGILSSVVLASLNSARAKGGDAAVKANLSNMRAQAELFYDTNSGYSSASLAGTSSGCTTANTLFVDPTITSAITAITNASAAPTCIVGGGTATTKSSAWSMSAPLKTSGNWCVDSTGASVSGTDSNSDADCGA
jgi:prepilin-type N-terminal cleavage/methylation domain-containing protein